jgi:hypothetical protein
MYAIGKGHIFVYNIDFVVIDLNTVNHINICPSFPEGYALIEIKASALKLFFIATLVLINLK